jgi:hypothetical protein
VDDLVPDREKELRDQPPVAARPKRLGAHEARNRLREFGDERLLPCVCAHPGRVAAESADAEAREVLLAGLATAPAAELFGVPVDDTGSGERRRQRGLPELRVSPRPGKAPDVDQRLHVGPAQALD